MSNLSRSSDCSACYRLTAECSTTRAMCRLRSVTHVTQPISRMLQKSSRLFSYASRSEQSLQLLWSASDFRDGCPPASRTSSIGVTRPSSTLPLRVTWLWQSGTCPPLLQMASLTGVFVKWRMEYENEDGPRLMT